MTIRLTLEQFGTLWSDLDLGDVPYPLDVAQHSTAGTDADHLSRDVEPLLRLLGRHDVAMDLVADVQGPVRALAASRGAFAVLAVVRAGSVELCVIRPTGLAAALLGVLPQQEAGAGHALSVPVEALARAAALVGAEDGENDHPWAGTAYDERSAFVKAGLSQVDAALMSELATSRVAGGQFGVTHTRHGQRRRSRMVVTWFDTPRGRYLMVQDGAWLSVAPADHQRLLTRVESLLSRSAAA